jgi:hypothetical protein
MYKVTVYFVNGTEKTFFAMEPADEDDGGDTTLFWKKEHGDFVTVIKHSVLYFEETKV